MISITTIAAPAPMAARVVTADTESETMTDTQPSTLPPPTPPGSGTPATSADERPDDVAHDATLRPAWMRHAAMVVAVAVAVAFLAVSVLSVIPSETFATKENVRLGIDQPAPYARVPASATPVDERIIIDDIDDVEQFPPEGDIYFVTVSEPEQSVLSWLLASDDEAIQFLTYEDKYGFQTAEQREVFALESMRTSEQVAQYVALNRLGFGAELVSGDVLIQQMVCLAPTEDGTECAEYSPSDEVLDPGDRIVAVEGTEVDTVDDLTALLSGLRPGDVVSMLIERPDEGEVEVDVELTSAPEDPERTIVGFYPFDTAEVNLPFELDIDTGRIGGPSAGLAFTLTLIDELSEGELTGGQQIAVTGTINLDGSVGAIGGLRQKASAVMQNGVDVFIVPATQSEADLEAARAVAGDDLEIITVEHLDDALAVLEELGGDPLPPTVDRS